MYKESTELDELVCWRCPTSTSRISGVQQMVRAVHEGLMSGKEHWVWCSVVFCSNVRSILHSRPRSRGLNYFRSRRPSELLAQQTWCRFVKRSMGHCYCDCDCYNPWWWWWCWPLSCCHRVCHERYCRYYCCRYIGSVACPPFAAWYSHALPCSSQNVEGCQCVSCSERPEYSLNLQLSLILLWWRFLA